MWNLFKKKSLKEIHDKLSVELSKSRANDIDEDVKRLLRLFKYKSSESRHTSYPEVAKRFMDAGFDVVSHPSYYEISVKKVSK